MVHQEDGEVYLTVKETCKRLGISRQSLNGYVKNGKLTKYTRGLAHRVFFKKSEVDEFLTARPQEERKRSNGESNESKG